MCLLLFAESQGSPDQTLQLQVPTAPHLTVQVMVAPRRGHIHLPVAPARWWPCDTVTGASTLL